MPPFTTLLITHNESQNLPQCLQALEGLSTGILIIDAFSEDNTVEIAEFFGAKVIQYKWEGYGQNKNFGNAQATHDWILSIDADEVLSEELKEAILRLEPQESTVYAINRLTNYCGHWVRHSNWHPDWNIRLFNRKTAKWNEDLVHEKLVFPANTQVVQLSGLLYHYSYRNSDEHWARIERYSQLSAKQLFQKGKKATFIHLWLSPIARFLKTFFLKNGWLDGKVGWTISIRNAYLVHRKYQILKLLYG